MPPEDPMIGRTLINQYVIKQKLGEGGFGAVYIADQPSMGRRVVVKVLHRHLTHNQGIVARFHREGVAASRLIHTAAVKMLNSGETEDGILWMAMEFLEGETLDARLRKKGPLEPKFFVETMGPICEVLAEAHEKGIVHRDLKPENIMLLPYPGGKTVPKVLDFGIAGLLDANDGATKNGMIVGTPQYMSPEQWGGLQNVDWRSDIYALGVIAYQALTTKLPFQADTTTGWMAKHCTEDPLNFDQVAPERKVPLAVQRVVMKALVKDPAARYQSTLELKQALEEALLPGAEEKARQEAAPTHKIVPKTGKPPEANPPPTPNNKLLPGLIVGGLALGAIVVLAVLQPWKGAPEPAPEPKPSTLAGTPPPKEPKTPPAPETQAKEPQTPPAPPQTPPGMIRYEGGELALGSADEEDMNPARRAKVEAFFLDRTEVSVADYQGCVSSSECFAPEEGETNGAFPVVNLPFSDAQRYCAWRAKKDKVKTRLPREEEWEFAARNGLAQAFPWGDSFDAQATFSAIGAKEPAPHPAAETPPVGARADRAINLIGNVAEWVDAGIPESIDSECAGDKCRVLRGGSYEDDDPKRLSAAFRNWAPRNERSYSIGFRCAASAQ
jgi:serine/threonine-protein kinase